MTINFNCSMHDLCNYKLYVMIKSYLPSLPSLPSLPTFLGKTQKTYYFQMLPSLPRFLGRIVLKSIDSKLWSGRLPSLPIFEGKSKQ